MFRCAVLAPMSPPKSSKRSRQPAPATDTAAGTAVAEPEEEEEVAVAALSKRKTPGRKGHGPAGADAFRSAQPNDPEQQLMLQVHLCLISNFRPFRQ